jgi:hypothetical protein
MLRNCPRLDGGMEGVSSRVAGESGWLVEVVRVTTSALYLARRTYTFLVCFGDAQWRFGENIGIKYFASGFAKFSLTDRVCAEERDRFRCQKGVPTEPTTIVLAPSCAKSRKY